MSAALASVRTGQAGEVWSVRLQGAWVAARAAELDRETAALPRPAPGTERIEIDLSQVERMDSAGAWLAERTRRALAATGLSAAYAGDAERYRALIALVASAADTPSPEAPRPVNPLIRVLNSWGAKVFDAGAEAKSLVNFLGLATLAAIRVIANPKRMRPKALATHMEQAGLDALPIVGLLAFLIGVVLAYQSADQLRAFGAEIFTVNLLGISILRVIGVLITAILIAGRSGSAFTAEIGSMQVREEIDAMRALGLDPVEVLVLPRIMALVVVLPLLAFFANVMAMTGGAVMALIVLGITPGQFLTQLNEAIGLGTLLVGLVQAPVFAALIALVGCYEGFRVERSAESVGRQTTRAVVESIFLVIVATALFSILFSALGV